MVKFDPHNHGKYYEKWKAKGMTLTGVSEANAKLIRACLDDLEIGTNINPSSRKGSRSPGRLRNLKSKMQTMIILMQQEIGIDDVADLVHKELELLKFFKSMRDGEFLCRKAKGKPLKAVGTYVRAFKTFWHWYQRTQKRQGKEIIDITVDIDSKDEKPKFNYITIENLNKLCNEAKFEYKAMMMFMFDSGIRSPTELMNVRLADLEWNTKQNHYVLNIREETSKTFGRKIKLLLCSEILKAYIATKNLSAEEYIFQKSPQRANQYIRVLAHKLLGIGNKGDKTKEGRPIITDGLSLYDFRHSSACYWLPRYKSESALKYRFGWKKSDMIHYYTDLLGMKDTIQEEDLYVDVSKTDLENQINQKGKEIELLQEQLQEQDKRMQEMLAIMKAIQLEKQVEQKLVLHSPRS